MNRRSAKPILVPITTAHPPNRLASESSPYLLQHAHNPVDWFAWGEEAFAEARKRDVPIFLSIGYSTCYWCHVMERESFESETIAEKMNDLFVCVKLDREERPDVDEIYMAATVTMTGHGGWPMSVFLDPKTLRPFWCGTYFPAEPMPGLGSRPTFPQVLDAMSGIWRTQRDAAHKQAEAITQAVAEQLAETKGVTDLSRQPISDAVAMLLRAFDRKEGGFGNAPKFPQPCFLDFLLDARTVAGDDSTADAIDFALKKTLDAMATGGICDHIGGGFHRYSVDASWTVPHFEKMLYDNAQLASVYARAAIHYGDEFYKSVARGVADYTLREMTSADGGFFSAQDAEVDGREGLNYLWNAAQIDSVFASDPDSASFANQIYGINDGPNFRDPHHPKEPASNVLRLADRPDRLAKQLDTPLPALLERAQRINTAMLAARNARKQPRLDDKCIASWNGMMIGAMADVYRASDDNKYLAAATRAADFVLAKMRTSDGRLLRSVRAGASGPAAVLEDYAFVIAGLLSLHRAAQRPLADALQLLDIADRDFRDGSGYSDSRADRPDLFVRPRSTHDGAVPAAASQMIHNLIDLAALTRDKKHLARAIEGVHSLSRAIVDSPVGAINSTRALLRLLLVEDVEVESLRAASVPAPEQPALAHPDPVEIYAAVDRVTISQGKPAELTLLIRIAEGYHIIAPDPGDSPAARALVPLRIDLAHGQGVAVYADYPAGEDFGSPSTGLVKILRGTIELRVALELEGEWKGRPILTATYQACSETECHAPHAVELDVAIDRS